MFSSVMFKVMLWYVSCAGFFLQIFSAGCCTAIQSFLKLLSYGVFSFYSVKSGFSPVVWILPPSHQFSAVYLMSLLGCVCDVLHSSSQAPFPSFSPHCNDWPSQHGRNERMVKSDKIIDKNQTKLHLPGFYHYSLYYPRDIEDSKIFDSKPAPWIICEINIV